ncbi:MAG: hypothetical protein DI551_10710 [Micavibrio aeruginosavorus]|uniref:Amidinotransferase n=1 Tax=Micavibrio aeruginosavorus TaxID=349221 RepID=A0A2W5MZS8_9BACT|nr:MAG: hypothetical protein DI551_10710 [Micavibrio aeruginosavorus]
MTDPQSTNHIMMMEPMAFHANPQTKETNSYQHEDDKDIAAIQKKAVAEFRAFRDLLVEHGVAVTTVYGQKGSPDDIFCNNWVSTLPGGKMTFYPMLADNRKIERRPELIALLARTYKDVFDLSKYENEGKYLESTGAMWLDKANKIAYQGQSQRSHPEMAKKWCEHYGYEHYPFETEHRGKPVYHTDVLMWIGTSLAGITSECLKSRDIVDHLKKKRDVVEFTNEQMAAFCGNSLEVIGRGGEKMLVMSMSGYKTLRDDQKSLIHKHYPTVISPEIPTIEYYGGGSARCMLLELF